MNSLSDVFREEPIPFVIYNNDLRSKSNVILHLRKRAVGLTGEEQMVFHTFKGEGRSLTQHSLSRILILTTFSKNNFD